MTTHDGNKDECERASQTPSLTERCKARLAGKATQDAQAAAAAAAILLAEQDIGMPHVASAEHDGPLEAPQYGCLCPPGHIPATHGAPAAGHGHPGDANAPHYHMMLTQHLSGPALVKVKKEAPMDLYVLGGYNGKTFDMDECSQMFKYDFFHRKWETIGKMPVPRFHHTAVAHGEHIYMMGGASISCADSARSSEAAGQVLSPTATNYAYHPPTKTWEELPPMKTRRVYHCAAAGFGDIYVFGGTNEEQTILDTVEIYDTEQKKWRMGPSLRHPLMGATATLCGGFIYVVGGITVPLIKSGPRFDRFNVINRAHYLDVYSKEWTALPSLPIPLVHHVGVCIHGEILIVGGSTSGRPQVKEKNKPHLISRRDIFAFNEESKKWELAGQLSAPRSGCGAAVQGSHISIVGGHGLVKGEVLDTMEHFDLYAKQLSLGVSLPLKRTALQLAAYPSPHSYHHGYEHGHHGHMSV